MQAYITRTTLSLSVDLMTAKEEIVLVCSRRRPARHLSLQYLWSGGQCTAVRYYVLCEMTGCREHTRRRRRPGSHPAPGKLARTHLRVNCDFVTVVEITNTYCKCILSRDAQFWKLIFICNKVAYWFKEALCRNIGNEGTKYQLNIFINTQCTLLSNRDMEMSQISSARVISRHANHPHWY